VFIVAYQSVALFIVATTANLRLALSLGGGYAVMAFTFSGITFPAIAMFRAIQPITSLFPLTWFTEIFIDQAMRGAPIEYSIKPLATLTLFLLLPLLTARRLQIILSNSQYWSKD
jgi:ABC-2 type transport system permease protein